MQYVLVGLYVIALGLYLWARPSWRSLGFGLADSYVAGIGLFATGSILVWQLTTLEHALDVLAIGMVAGIAGTGGAALWSWLLRRQTCQIDFLTTVRSLKASPADKLGLNLGFLAAGVVTLWFLGKVLMHDHVRSLLNAALFNRAPTYAEARLILATGIEGYFAPGYVKQFRDNLIPILCTASILAHGSYRNKPLFYVALFLGTLAMFIAGQRLSNIQLILCLGTVVVLDALTSRERFIPLKISIPILIAMCGGVVLMTQMLGRLDMALLPVAPPAASPSVPPKPATVEPDRMATATQSETTKPATPDTAGPVGAQETSTKPKASEPLDPVPPKPAPAQQNASNVLSLSALALAHRSLMAVPQENAVTYKNWAAQSPAWGKGWVTDMGTVKFGMQPQLSNELAEKVLGSALGNSPLGLPADLFYNWGLWGVAIFSSLFALLFLLMDIYLLQSGSLILFGAKIFLIFSIPTMYSPFLFLLYGGAVVLAMMAYIAIARTGFLAFLGVPGYRSVHPD